MSLVGASSGINAAVQDNQSLWQGSEHHIPLARMKKYELNVADNVCKASEVDSNQM